MNESKRQYYEAYEERYKTAHRMGVSWMSAQSTPIVKEILEKYRILPCETLLEIGCGEGRDARVLLEEGYDLLASDLSREAIAYCKETMPAYTSHFQVMDCLTDDSNKLFDFIYSVAVIHMLVRDQDRKGFYQFIYRHLKPGGISLICTMGDGIHEMQSDIRQAFDLQERDHPSGKMQVAATSCRMVSFETFAKELDENGFYIMEKGITESLPDFDSLMYAVAKKKTDQITGEIYAQS